MNVCVIIKDAHRSELTQNLLLTSSGDKTNKAWLKLPNHKYQFCSSGITAHVLLHRVNPSTYRRELNGTPTLGYCMVWGDMIDTYKILHGIYDRDVADVLILHKDLVGMDSSCTTTRGHTDTAQTQAKKSFGICICSCKPKQIVELV